MGILPLAVGASRDAVGSGALQARVPPKISRAKQTVATVSKVFFIDGLIQGLIAGVFGKKNYRSSSMCPVLTYERITFVASVN